MHKLWLLLNCSESLPTHAASAFAFCAHASFFSFHTVATLTKCSLLTNICKITSSSASLIDVTVTSLMFHCYTVFVDIMKKQKMLVSNAGVKFTRHKTWGCPDLNGIVKCLDNLI